MKIFDRAARETMPDESEFEMFVKTTPTKMTRIQGPFKVMTLHGLVECEDGWLAVDEQGWPYPVDARVHAQTYRPYEPDGIDLGPA